MPDVNVRDQVQAIQGAGNPVVTSIGFAAIALDANTADQEIVAAQGADTQIWVLGMAVTANTGAGTITFQDSADAAHSGAFALSDEGGFVLPMSGNYSMPWFKVATNKALEADTVTLSAAGLLVYAVVDVS